MSNTGHKYVYNSPFSHGKPFYALIKIRNKQYHAGYYATIEEAVAAARGFNKAVKKFGPLWRFTRNKK